MTTEQSSGGLYTKPSDSNGPNACASPFWLHVLPPAVVGGFCIEYFFGPSTGTRFQAFKLTYVPNRRRTTRVGTRPTMKRRGVSKYVTREYIIKRDNGRALALTPCARLVTALYTQTRARGYRFLSAWIRQSHGTHQGGLDPFSSKRHVDRTIQNPLFWNRRPYAAFSTSVDRLAVTLGHRRSQPRNTRPRR